MLSVVVCPVVPVVNPLLLRGHHFPLWFIIPVVIVCSVIVIVGIVELIKIQNEYSRINRNK